MSGPDDGSTGDSAILIFSVIAIVIVFTILLLEMFA
jgi:hypothetical protein